MQASFYLSVDFTDHNESSKNHFIPCFNKFQTNKWTHHKELKFDCRVLPALNSSATMPIVLASVSWGRLILTRKCTPTNIHTNIHTAANAFPVNYAIHGIQSTDQHMNLKVILLSTLTTKNFRQWRSKFDHEILTINDKKKAYIPSGYKSGLSHLVPHARIRKITTFRTTYHCLELEQATFCSHFHVLWRGLDRMRRAVMW